MTIENSCHSISVVVVTRNDRAFIRDCLDSLLAQDVGIDELIVVDCGSTDGTPTVISTAADVTKVVPHVAPGEVLEVSGRTARGDTICVADARATYAPDAIRDCVNHLRSGGTEPGGADQVLVGTTNFGRSVAAMARCLPMVRPAVVCWTAIREPGPASAPARPGVRCWRFGPDSPAELAAESFRAGARRATHNWRHIDPVVDLPAAMVLASAIGALGGHGRRRITVPIVHGILCAIVAVRSACRPGVSAHRTFLALEAGHWSAGAGVWGGIARGRRSAPSS